MTMNKTLAAAVADFRACHTDHDTDAAALKAVAARHKGVTEAALQTALEVPAVTKLSPGRARGVTKKTAPQTVAKVTRGQKAAGMTNAPKRGKAAKDDTKAPTKRTRKASTKAAAPKAKKEQAAPKAKAGNTLTTVDIAAEHDMNAKTLRARIRRNIDKWEPLFADGERHVFKDNATTRKAIAALLDAE